MESVIQGTYTHHFGNSILHSKISADASDDVAAFIFENLGNSELSEDPLFLINGQCGEQPRHNVPLIIDLKNVNLQTDLNKHFTSINRTIANSGIYIGCFRSHYNNKRRTIPGIFSIKLLPKLKRNGTANKQSSFALPEVLGRLVYCGFEIVNYKYFERNTFFIARKKSETQNGKNVSSALILKMERIGKDGKIIKIYKIRTMYPYSEYLQDYVVKINGYNELGKPNNDFRLLKYGKILRRLYIDEIPQVINLLKGEINIIGVRPLSQPGLSYLPADLKNERIKNKPGLIPPQIALCLKGIEGVIKAERKYLEEYKKNPFKTNVKYFFLAVFNILTFRVKGN